MTEKISRICWNDFGWTRPSGTNGKSPSSTAYENQKGFGHEEWFLDKSKIVNGYHYGFLQPLGLMTDLHVGQTYKLWLYTITSRQNFLVGNIDKAICISKDESIEIYDIYKRNGWIKEMIKDLENAGINPSFFKKTSTDIFFNITIAINSQLKTKYIKLRSSEVYQTVDHQNNVY